MRTEQEALEEWQKDQSLKYGDRREYPVCQCPDKCAFHGT